MLFVCLFFFLAPAADDNDAYADEDDVDDSDSDEEDDYDDDDEHHNDGEFAAERAVEKALKTKAKPGAARKRVQRDVAVARGDMEDFSGTRHGIERFCAHRASSDLVLKADHASRPLWVCPDGHLYLERFSPIYQQVRLTAAARTTAADARQAYDFLIAIAEPSSRPLHIHECA